MQTAEQAGRRPETTQAGRSGPHLWTIFLTFPARESRIKLLPEIHLQTLAGLRRRSPR